MKFILKQDEPEELMRLKELESENWQAAYDALGGRDKKAIHASLLMEQGCICCYCNMRISEESSHIEHLRPQSKFPDLTLEYRNMLASCQLRSMPGEPRRCGVKKVDWFNDALMVSPLDQSCESRFKFNDEGAIAPVDPRDEAARETICRLGLDIDWIRSRRKSAIREALNEEDTPDEIRKLIDGFQQRDEQGHFEPFCTAIIHALSNKIAEWGHWQ